MAAEATVTDLKLTVTLDTGEVKSGKATTVSQTWSNIKTTATDDQLLALGDGLASLCKYDLDSVKKTVVSKLSTAA